MDTEGKKIHFHQGRKAGEYTNEEECLKSIKQKLAELSNIKNVSFLLGSGASSGAIPVMKELQKIIEQKIKSRPEGISEEINNLYENVCGGGKNLEKILEILYAKRKYLAEIYDTNQQTKNDVNTLIAYIEESIYKEVNVNDCKIKESLRIYKEFESANNRYIILP